MIITKINSIVPTNKRFYFGKNIQSQTSFDTFNNLENLQKQLNLVKSELEAVKILKLRKNSIVSDDGMSSLKSEVLSINNNNSNYEKIEKYLSDEINTLLARINALKK